MMGRWAGAGDRKRGWSSDDDVVAAGTVVGVETASGGCCHGVADGRVVLSSSLYSRPIPASPRIRSAPSESGFADREWHGQLCHGLRGCPFRPFTAPSPIILPLSTRSGCRARPCPVARMQTPVRRIAVTRRTEGSLHGRVHVCSCRRSYGARPADGRGRTIAAGRSGSCWRSRRSLPGIPSSGAIGLPVGGYQWAWAFLISGSSSPSSWLRSSCCSSPNRSGSGTEKEERGLPWKIRSVHR